MDKPKDYAAEIAALILCMETIFVILDGIEPDEIEHQLRVARLAVQEEGHGRLTNDDAALTDARVIYRDILERAVARSREAE